MCGRIDPKWWICNRNMLFQATNAPVPGGKRVSPMNGASITERFSFRPLRLYAHHNLLEFHDAWNKKIMIDSIHTYHRLRIHHCGHWVEIAECLAYYVQHENMSCQQGNIYTIGQQRFRGVLDCNKQSKTASINLSVLTYCTTNATKWLHFVLGQLLGGLLT